MFKITFEKVVIIILILILLLSTANIYTQYYKQYFAEDNSLLKNVKSDIPRSNSFSGLLDKADKYFNDAMYQEAIDSYNDVLLQYSTLLSDKQKTLAIYRKGISYFRLGDYKKAQSSFLELTTVNPKDSLAYNNAAVSAFYQGDYEAAALNLTKALDILPAVEYYYNIGRVRETIEEYKEAAKYFIAVSRAEENLTLVDKIDPIQLKNKVQNLIPDQTVRDELADEILIALKYKDTRELFTIEDQDMDIKDISFSMNVDNVKGTSILNCSFDRVKADPYNLINSIIWTVYRDGKKVFTNNKDSFSTKFSESGSYDVYLNVKYSSVLDKEKYSHGSFAIVGKETKVDVAIEIEDVAPTSAPKPKTKKYLIASYEQLFEKSFEISTHGYVDEYNVVWGKDNVETKIIEVQKVDFGGSLYIKNVSDKDEGIWANLSSLLDSTDMRGKKITIYFWARKITDHAKLDIKVRASSINVFTESETFALDNKWADKSISMYVPDDAARLTFSLYIKPGEEVEIDGFRVIVHK